MPNLERLSDFAGWFAVLHGEIDPPELAHEERLLVKEAAATAEKLDWAAEPGETLTEELKESSGKKGRELFHPLRLALTGRESGPEMAGLVCRNGPRTRRPPPRSRGAPLILRSTASQQ